MQCRVSGGSSISFSSRAEFRFSARYDSRLAALDVEEASAGLATPSFELSGGLQTHQYGLCTFYKPRSIYNPLFNNPVIWNSAGMSMTVGAPWNGYRLKNGITVFSKESGAIYGLMERKTAKYEVLGLTGAYIRSISGGMFDYTLGADFLRRGTRFLTHLSGKYTYCHGRILDGQRRNLFELLAETWIVAAPKLSIISLLHTEIEGVKAPDETVFLATMAQSMVSSHYGFELGAESRVCTPDITLSPVGSFVVQPVVTWSIIRIGVKRTFWKSGRAKTSITGEVWWYF
jgi:hypothetical protein